MPAVAVVTLVIATLIIAAAALGLLRVILHLRAVAGTLDGVIDGVHAVAEQTALVPAGLAVGQRQPQAGPRLLRDDMSALR